jgi:hypothetical protein
MNLRPNLPLSLGRFLDEVKCLSILNQASLQLTPGVLGVASPKGRAQSVSPLGGRTTGVFPFL